MKLQGLLWPHHIPIYPCHNFSSQSVSDKWNQSQGVWEDTLGNLRLGKMAGNIINYRSWRSSYTNSFHWRGGNIKGRSSQAHKLQPTTNRNGPFEDQLSRRGWDGSLVEAVALMTPVGKGTPAGGHGYFVKWSNKCEDVIGREAWDNGGEY